MHMASPAADDPQNLSTLRTYQVVDADLRVVLAGESPTSLVPAAPGTVLALAILQAVRQILVHHRFERGPAVTLIGRVRLSVVRLPARDGSYYGIATERIVAIARAQKRSAVATKASSR